MRKLIGKIILWFLKGQTIHFDNGYCELPDYTHETPNTKNKPLGRFKVK